jgi:hypothetical protein
MQTKFWLESWEGRDHSENLGIDQRIILKMKLRETGLEGFDWAHPAQDWEPWWALVGKVMNLWVSLKSRECLDQLSQLLKDCSMGLVKV